MACFVKGSSGFIMSICVLFIVIYIFLRFMITRPFFYFILNLSVILLVLVSTGRSSETASFAPIAALSRMSSQAMLSNCACPNISKLFANFVGMKELAAKSLLAVATIIEFTLRRCLLLIWFSFDSLKAASSLSTISRRFSYLSLMIFCSY